MEIMASMDKFASLILKGAFLTTNADGKRNTMTIGWGSFGIRWNRKMFTVLVRDSRYTKQLIDAAGEFTVTVPLDDVMKSQLAFCGSKSGRDVDKFAALGLQTIPAQTIHTPVIACNALQFECRIVHFSRMANDALDGILKSQFYPSGDFHTMYDGEILSMYETTA